jgi:hypothetical protein
MASRLYPAPGFHPGLQEASPGLSALTIIHKSNTGILARILCNPFRGNAKWRGPITQGSALG